MPAGPDFLWSLQVSFTLHPNDREIVTASRSLLLRHWDIATGECKRAIKAHDHRVLCMDYDGLVFQVAVAVEFDEENSKQNVPY